MRVNLSNSSLQNRYFSGTGSIGGIHLPDFNDKYIFSKRKAASVMKNIGSRSGNRPMRILKKGSSKTNPKDLIG